MPLITRVVRVVTKVIAGLVIIAVLVLGLFVGQVFMGASYPPT